MSSTRPSLFVRWLDAASLYLPLALMSVLAAGSWYLASSTLSSTDRPHAQALPPEMPDYTLSHFAVSRFDAQGTLRAHMHASSAQHLSTGDALHIQAPHSRWHTAQGAITIAHAQQAISHAGGEFVDLTGDAHIHIHPAAQQDTPTAPILVQSNTFRLWPEQEKLHSAQAVRITRSDARIDAVGMDFSGADQTLQLHSQVRAVLPASAPKAP